MTASRSNDKLIKSNLDTPKLYTKYFAPYAPTLPSYSSAVTDTPLSNMIARSEPLRARCKRPSLSARIVSPTASYASEGCVTSIALSLNLAIMAWPVPIPSIVSKNQLGGRRLSERGLPLVWERAKRCRPMPSYFCRQLGVPYRSAQERPYCRPSGIYLPVGQMCAYPLARNAAPDQRMVDDGVNGG